MMADLEAKELFYRTLVEGIESRVNALLEACHRPAAAKSPEERAREREAEEAEAAASARPMAAWKSAANEGAPSSELLSEVPREAAASRLGTEGTFSISKLRASARHCKAQPGMLVTPPVDVELFAAATRLGLAHAAQQRIIPRLVNDLTRQHIAEPAEVAVLHALVSDPSVQVYPTELAAAIHQAHGRMELMRTRPKPE